MNWSLSLLTRSSFVSFHYCVLCFILWQTATPGFPGLLSFLPSYLPSLRFSVLGSLCVCVMHLSTRFSHVPDNAIFITAPPQTVCHLILITMVMWWPSVCHCKAVMLVQWPFPAIATGYCNHHIPFCQISLVNVHEGMNVLIIMHF